MPEDILSTLDSTNLDEFKKDFIELIRVNSGINKEYSKLSKDIDKYIPQFKQIVNLFNKKYKNLAIRLKQTTEELKLRIFMKDKSVKDVLINAEKDSSNISLEPYKNGLIELHYGDEIANEKSPEFKLCAYYATKGDIKNINIREILESMGFIEKPFLEKVRMFFKKFNPRIEE